MVMENTVASASSQVAANPIWVIDPSHSLVEFSGRHMMVSTVKGRFTGVSGTFAHDEVDPTKSWVEVDIDASTLNTADEKRDAHLKSADFLDVANFPTITFKSTRVEPVGNSGDHLRITGNLTIHGETKPVTLDTQFNGRGKTPWGGEVAGYSAETEINRKDFGLGWNVALEAGGWLVGDKIKVSLEVEASRQQ